MSAERTSQGRPRLETQLRAAFGIKRLPFGKDLESDELYVTDAFERAQDALDYEARIERVLEAVERCPLPTVAAINGACTGGGAAIAGACDIRIATANLKFGFPIARTLGNCLAAANLARLSSLMGAGRVREMIFTARLIGAEEAQGCGLVTEVLEDEDALMARAGALADTLAQMAPLTLRAT